MLRILLSLSAVIAACSPSPQEATMHQPGPPRTAGQKMGMVASDSHTHDGKPASPDAVDRQRAAQGPILEAVSAADNPVARPTPMMAADQSAEALGRRTLSTAFVMISPDGYLTVELYDGHKVVLRDVIMRAKDYCGVRIVGNVPGKKYCGGYADVASARPGGAPVPGDQNHATSEPVNARQKSD